MLTGEMESFTEAMERMGSSTPEEMDEKAMSEDIMASLGKWAAELEGHATPGPSRNELGWRIDFLGEEMTMLTEVLRCEKSLKRAERAGFEEELDKFRQWREELRRLRRASE